MNIDRKVGGFWWLFKQNLQVIVMYDVKASKNIMLINLICPKTNNQICATGVLVSLRYDLLI